MVTVTDSVVAAVVVSSVVFEIVPVTESVVVSASAVVVWIVDLSVVEYGTTIKDEKKWK